MPETQDARKPVGGNDDTGVGSTEPIVWSREEEAEDTNGDTSSFETLCMLAAETKRPLHLYENVILKDTITLRKRQSLAIINKSTERVSLSGDLHSLFLLNNHSELILENNIELKHTLEVDDHRKVGAAVNLRYKSKLTVTDSSISSTCGFCCWAVQKTTVTLSNCQLQAKLRSPVVCFGQPKVLLDNCVIEQAGVHAVCARGACHVTVRQCHISKSASRAVYAYAEASVQLIETTITETMRSDKAAVEVSAAGGKGRTSSITIQDCQIIDNAGIGLLLRGNVKWALKDSVVERNAGGNILQTTSLQDDDGETNVLQRDPAGSSFRQGDWWCPNCQPRHVVIGGESNCSKCNATQEQDHALSVSEISQLNQGVLSDNASTVAASWYFDGDEHGWVRYDDTSNQLLEEIYQKYANAGQHVDPLVLLPTGEYQVNLEKMEQVNVSSQFLRLVKRIPAENTAVTAKSPQP